MSFHKVLIVSSLILFLSLAGCQSSAAPPADVPELEVPENQANPNDPEQADEPQENMSFMGCPTSGETLTLGFDHALTIEQPDVNLTHLLKEGFLTLSAEEADADGTVSLSSAGNTSMGYEMIGEMGPCSVELAGSMQASASGTCIDGVVYLTIIETWQPGSGTMTCDDDVVPFNSPGPGSFVHEGADGAGEVFYLVDGSAGYTVMRPFGEGSGYHSWTLYASQIDLVPLVP